MRLRSHCALAVLSAVLSVGACIAWAPPAGAQAIPSFSGVGDLPGGAADSAASDVSADGTVVVGLSESSAGTEAFTWTASGGIAGLGFLSGSDPRSEAVAVSGDGSVVAGTSRNSSGEERAVRWSGGGITSLGTFSCSGCDPTTTGLDLSDDGQVVVGAGLAKSLFGDPRLHAARWPGGGTGIDDIGDLSGPATFNTAHGVSGNGGVIVGTGETSASPRGWWWSSGSGMNALPDAPGALSRSTAQAVSADGSVVVGSANTSGSTTGHLEAARWIGGGFGTLELLGALPGVTVADSEARDVSGGGEVVVGRAVSASSGDRAFVWDATNGMRDLNDVLASDYGLDPGGWALEEAFGVSDVGPDGGFTVVGAGTNPQGEPEGWVAFLVPPACSNGVDDDGDGDVDFPDDLECTSPTDFSELLDCADGVDNDGDGDADYPADAGCRDASDPTERFDCEDGLDNDGDGDADHPADAGCAAPQSPREDPACDDGVDNDTDGDIDFPADAQCTAAFDLSEVPDCSDGLDNDGDGLFDLADPDCADANDPTEAPECSDGVDNDGDGRVDYPEAYPSCSAATDVIEAPQCSDGVDNDGDGDVDLADADCTDAGDVNEASLDFATGDVLVVDRASRILFALDPVTGDQTRLSEAAFLGDPQGVAQTATGTPVIADPAGLVEVDPQTGAQRLASDPLDAGASLQLVFDAAGDAYVLESTGITQVTWTLTGTPPSVPFLPVPTPEPIPVLGQLVGDTLALEASGDLLTTGVSFGGDGVYRIGVAGPTVAILDPGFTSDIWLDLAVEGDGTILGVGTSLASGPGVYRIDPVSGAAAALSVGAPWQRPTGVAVGPSGDIYVADAGDCSSGPCTGGEIVHVDPVSGARSVIGSGGFVQGELDIDVALPEPGTTLGLGAGSLALAGLARRRLRKPGRKRDARR